MTDTNHTTDEVSTAPDESGSTTGPGQTAPDHADGGVTGRDDTLLNAALAVLAVLALVATIRFYLSLSSAIGTWVTHEYRDLAQAAFNLVVLLVTGVGISLVLRQLARES